MSISWRVTAGNISTLVTYRTSMPPRQTLCQDLCLSLEFCQNNLHDQPWTLLLLLNLPLLLTLLPRLLLFLLLFLPPKLILFPPGKTEY
jgi:hypothetical protein